MKISIVNGTFKRADNLTRVSVIQNGFIQDKAPFIPRGVSHNGLKFDPDFVKTMTKQLNWKGNHVRVPVHLSWWTGSQAQKDLIDECIDWAEDNYLQIILDWHALDEGTGNADWTDPLIVQKAIDFWEWAAPRYAKRTHVIYEMWNEPYNADFGITNESYQSWNVVAQQLYDLIRSFAPSTLILVGNPAYCLCLRFARVNQINGTNVAYVGHFYQNNFDNLYPEMSWSEIYDYYLGVTADELPVWITEFGYSDDPSQNEQHFYNEDLEYWKRFVGYMDSKEKAGMTLFSTVLLGLSSPLTGTYPMVGKQYVRRTRDF